MLRGRGMNIKQWNDDIIKISRDNELFPEELKTIETSPEYFYCKGNTALLKGPKVAIVGSRKCTEYGKMVAFRLAEKLSSNGITIVSGLATGIDEFAHKGALAGGNTIAVLAGGLNICYPKKNKKLFERISETGLLISEREKNYQSQRFDFPLRNRIISGLCESVVIVEAADGSGSLITAGLALSQGRNVYAVPGNINSAQSLGTNKLIKEGAQPLTTLNDILIDMNIAPQKEERVMNALSKDEKVVYEHVIKRGEISFEELAFLTGFTMAKVKGITSVLEIKGVITTAIGKIYIAK